MSKESERKGNGKDDGFEEVQGRATPKSTGIGLRATTVRVKESGEGAAIAEMTVTGRAASLTRVVGMVGEQVNVITPGGAGGHGKCLQVTIKAPAKEGGPKITSLKIVGARELDRLVGLQVTVDSAQAELPLRVEASPDDAVDEIRKLKPKDHALAVNPPPEPHKKRGARQSADGRPWAGSSKKGRGKGAEARA